MILKKNREKKIREKNRFLDFGHFEIFFNPFSKNVFSKIFPTEFFLGRKIFKKLFFLGKYFFKIKFLQDKKIFFNNFFFKSSSTGSQLSNAPGPDSRGPYRRESARVECKNHGNLPMGSTFTSWSSFVNFLKIGDFF